MSEMVRSSDATSVRSKGFGPHITPVPEPAINAALFARVNHVLVESGEASSDYRKHRLYQHPQLIARYNGSEPPQQSDFELLCVHELSARGFSFYSSVFPDYRFVVIALGKVPFSFFSAEIITTYVDQPSGRFLVTCRFLRRIGEPTLPTEP